jgi:CubicO group peptidase (beta-lactamase class C family)
MARFDFAFFQLLFRIVSRQTGEISRVAYTPQKKRYEDVPEEKKLPRATPESQGISSACLAAYLQALAADPGINAHHAMVLRHGCVIAECSFAPYRDGMWHVTHSMCKSITGMAVGLLIGEGKLSLEEKVADIFADYGGKRMALNAITAVKLRGMTVWHLLTMTSHAAFYEAGAISGNDWRRGFLEAGAKETPGTSFEYNSMNSYMLSAIVTEKTGLPMADYLRSRLFEPLGITELFWETCPMGITKGGWGLFLRPEDAAKLGQLYLQKGKWEGRAILPEEWIEMSTEKQIDNGSFGYGCQVWMEERPGGFAFNGMLGQDVVVYPDLDMVLTVNAGNSEMTQDGGMTALMRKTFGVGFAPADRLPENPVSYGALQALTERLAGKGNAVQPIEKGGWNRTARLAKRNCQETPAMLTAFLDGRTYEMEEKTVGIFPLLMQVFHNNFTDGIGRIGFEKRDGILTMILYEGEEIHALKVGFEHAEISEITVHQETYAVGVKGRASTDEEGRPVLILRADFLEEACSRRIRFYFEDGKTEVKWQEIPGEDVLLDGLHFVDASPGAVRGRLIKSVMEDGGRDILDSAVRAAIRPTVWGKEIQKP